MADIQSKILSKYGIDIAQENILKLYKVDSPDISAEDLEAKIQETHKRWNTSINGANEKNASRDKARLEKADKYEAILKNKGLLREVFDYYNNPNGKKTGGSGDASVTEFAREYFELVATTKKLNKKDVEFFFKYYQSERKNKKAILEMLEKDMKVAGLGGENEYAGEEKEGITEEKRANKKDKKEKKSSVIVNLFSESTILNIRKAFDKYDEASRTPEVLREYPEIKNTLYSFLELDTFENVEQFSASISAKSKAAYAVRQEKGAEFVPLVDLYNKFQSIAECKDVVDNFPEFKLLIKYPNLTPYMFAFVDMKPGTLKKMLEVAKRDYFFRDETDFILSYYKPIYDNFGISDGGIRSILKKAQKRARQNEALNKLDSKLGRNRDRKKLPIGAKIIHWLVYWPIFVTCFVYELVRAVFSRLYMLEIPLFIALFAFESWLLPKIGLYNLGALSKLIHKNEWLKFIYGIVGTVGDIAIETILISLIAIIIILAINILPPLVGMILLSSFSSNLNKDFDWWGYHRTFREIFKNLRERTEEQYLSNPKRFIKSGLGKALINVGCVVLIVLLVIYVPKGLNALSKETGYFQEDTIDFSTMEADE